VLAKRLVAWPAKRLERVVFWIPWIAVVTNVMDVELRLFVATRNAAESIAAENPRPLFLPLWMLV
jgi:hypothetical protein